jgi:hypothetical protein
LAIRRNPDTGALDGDPATTGGLFIAPGNAGTIMTDGIDLGINYRRDLGFSKLNLSFLGNWTNRSKFLANPASDLRSCVGQFGQNCGSPGSAGPSSTPARSAEVQLEPAHHADLRRGRSLAPVAPHQQVPGRG